MEGGHNKGSKTSSDEAESPVHVNEDAATGRFYECVFCKRGFSTAQALGGHMNIHRKDRARMRQNPTPVVSRKAEEEAICYGYHHHPYTGQTPYYPTVSESLRSYPSHFPASTSGARDTSVHRDGHYESARPRELRPFGEELQLRLGMHAEMEKTKEEEGELDLELRLGY